MQIFRKESMDRISSPEMLNDYVRVLNPGIWMVLAAVLVFLGGLFVLGFYGRIDTVVHAGGMVRDGELVCYVREAQGEQIREGMRLLLDGEEMHISHKEEIPQMLTEETDPYLMHLGGLNTGEWVYAVTCSTALEDGIYPVSIITGTVSPISYIWN